MDTFTSFADLVDDHYVLAGHGATYADRIRADAAQLQARLPDHDAVNALLHRLVPDRHLGLRRPAPDATGSGNDVERAGGFVRVDQLEGGMALVEIRPFFAGPEQAAAALTAVATLVADADALVLDLRRCFGGDTDTAALIHGWLLGPEPVRIGRFEHRGHPSIDYTSNPCLGSHFVGEVRVLTSAQTFSGGEDLAYVLQAHRRARVIGETTAGGAHPVEHFDLPGGYTCQIPVARPVIELTGSNWEGTGVAPDRRCSSSDALTEAISDLTDSAVG